MIYSLSLNMAIEPGTNLQWDRESKKFTAVFTDPVTGVETKLSSDPSKLISTRYDISPNNRYTRYIREDAYRPQKPVTYRVYDDNKNVEIIRLKDTKEVEWLEVVHHFPMEEKGISAVYVYYDSKDGILKNFSVVPSSFDKEEQKASSYFERPFSQNISSLIQLIKEEGVESVWPEFNEERAQELAYDVEADVREIKSRLSQWPEEMTEPIADDVIEMTARLLTTGDNRLSKEQAEEVWKPLLLSILKSLVDNLDNYITADAKKREKLLLEASYYAIAGILFNYEFDKDFNGDGFYSLDFKSNPDDKKGFDVEVKTGSIEPESKDFHKTGETFRYESYKYKVDQVEDGKIVVTITNVFSPDYMQTLVFPSRVDVKTIEDLITTPKPSGWEKVLEEINIQV